MNIVIAQYYTENLTHGPYAEVINKKYADEQGYGYFVEKNNDKIWETLKGKTPTWYKPHLILEIFETLNPDYVLFLDTDAIISDTEGRIEQFIDKEYSFIAAEDNSEHSLMNAGVFLIRNNAWGNKFLKDWITLGETTKPNNVKNLIISEHDKETEGYFLQRLWMDQTLLTLMYENYEEYRNEMKIISSRSFNWMRYKDDNFIFHAYYYNTIPNRTIDLIHNDIFNIKIELDRDNLSNLATVYHTDKHHGHNYFNEIYQDLFFPIKDTISKFVELGVHEGASIMIWREFFQNAEIIGLDISADYHKFHDKTRITLESINSGIKETLINFANKHNDLDVFMDDGSHIMDHQQITLATIFKSVKSGGIYVLEDLHTSVSVKNDPNSIWRSEGGETTTLDMLENFVETGKIVSDFLTEEECIYLEENIKECKIYKLQPHWSYTSVIIKK